MSKPLMVSESHLNQHFSTTKDLFTNALPIPVTIEVDQNTTPIVAALSGAECERIERNRGVGTVAVAPMQKIRDDLWSWISYREEWERAERKMLRFRTASLTFYFGLKSDRFKPQMFRLEWSGWANWYTDTLGFQAANAGHPHWQFDVLESLSDDEGVERANILRDLLRDNTENEVQEFAPQMPSSDVRDLVSMQSISRIHFPSAAAWWQKPPHESHAHSPESSANIRKWLEKSLDYISIELDRL